MTKSSKDDIAALIEQEVEAIESDRDATTIDTTVTRGNGRSKTLQVQA